MAKQPSKPGIPILDESETGSGRHRTCATGRTAMLKVNQLSQRMSEHVGDDGERFDVLSRDVEQVSKKVEAVSEHVGDLRVDVAKVSSIVGNINATLTEQSEIRRVRVIAEVEDQNDIKKVRRQIWLKVVLVAVAACGTALGVAIEHYR